MTTLVATNPSRKLDLKWRGQQLFCLLCFVFTGLTFLSALFTFQDQINIETKIKNIRFIGELCKFKMAPPALVFSCLKVRVYEAQN